jgi:hypothetical protein
MSFDRRTRLGMLSPSAVSVGRVSTAAVPMLCASGGGCADALSPLHHGMQKKIKLKAQASVFACHQPARKAGGSGEAGEDPLLRTAHGATFAGVTRRVCITGCGATHQKVSTRSKDLNDTFQALLRCQVNHGPSEKCSSRAFTWHAA